MSIDERVYGLEQRTRLLETPAGGAGGSAAAVTAGGPASSGGPGGRTRAAARIGASTRDPAPAAAPPRAAASVAPPAPPRVAPPSPPPARRRADAPALEDLLGGRVLAWAGGLTLLAGLLFFLVIAISRDWIGEEARTLLAAATSIGLLALGAHGYERRGRTDSALAATATGIAGLFASIVVAVQGYELIPAAAGLALAFAVAVTATALAIRWEAEGIAGLGILGAVASPVLVGAELGAATTAFLFVATASAVAVVLWQRWTLARVRDVRSSPPRSGSPGSSPGRRARPRSSPPCSRSAASASPPPSASSCGRAAPRSTPPRTCCSRSTRSCSRGSGWTALSETAGNDAANAWLAGLAVVHLACAAAGRRVAGVSRDLTLAAAVLGVVLADVAFATSVDGLPLVAGWAASAVALAALARAATDRFDAEVALGGVAVQLGLALWHTLVYDAPLSSVGAAPDLAAGLAVALVAAGCFASARIAGPALEPQARMAVEGAALALGAYLAAVVLDGPALTVTLAAAAIALAEAARRYGDPLARAGAVGFLGCAALHVLAVLAPVDALVVGLDDPLGALALLAVAGAALATARVPGVDRVALLALAAVTVLYLASTELISAFQPVDGEAAVGGLGVRQQGQALLSGLWAVVGVATLLAGLVRDRHELRVGALALLSVTLVKVFLYDLSSLDSLYRVASFVALGALLLLGAFAWQRLRPPRSRSAGRASGVPLTRRTTAPGPPARRAPSPPRPGSAPPSRRSSSTTPALAVVGLESSRARPLTPARAPR